MGNEYTIAHDFNMKLKKGFTTGPYSSDQDMAFDTPQNLRLQINHLQQA